MNRQTIFPGFALALILLTAACSKDDDGTTAIVETSATTDVLMPTAGEKATFTFETSGNWTASTTADWLSISPTKGNKGSNMLTATTKAINRTGAERTAIVTVSVGTLNKTFNVRQSGEYAMFDQKTYHIGAEGGELAMTFKSNITNTKKLLVAYQERDWLSFKTGDETRREWSGEMTAINVEPNTGREQRTAAFALALERESGSWVELDTAMLVQAGLSSSYTSTDYSEDGKVSILQTHTTGNGIPMVIMGDGFTDRDLKDSTYHTVMTKAMENIFSEEPARSLRNYFDVYMINAVSENDVVGEDYKTVFSCVPDYLSTNIDADEATITRYAEKINRADSLNMLAVVILNTNVRNGVTYLYNRKGRPSQFAIALCSICESLESEEFRLVLVHEAIGHGLAKLADEYGYDYKGEADEEARKTVNKAHEDLWMTNVDTTDDVTKVQWWRFVGDSLFSNENIGAYEGGYTYAQGIWKPTQQSMMNQNDSPFNAPSRKAIYDRIRSLGMNAKTSTLDEFATFDAQHKPERWEYTTRAAGSRQQRVPTPPRIINK